MNGRSTGKGAVPVLRTWQVELACAIEETVAFQQWRERLRALRVVRASRSLRHPLFTPSVCLGTEWEIELEADGWRATLESKDPFDAVDIAEFRAELIDVGWGADDLRRDRLIPTLRWVLRSDLAAANKALAPSIADACSRPPEQ